jgi:hypothetical protein
MDTSSPKALLNNFNDFLKSINLQAYRKKYAHIKIVEMDLPKDVQAIQLLYRVYWEEKNMLTFEQFYERYFTEKNENIEKFKVKSTMCNDCFSRGLEARIYRTWAGLITQIHAGYVAECVFGEGSVSMSEELDHAGADIRVEYRKHFLNYQIKKTGYSGVMSRKPLPRENKLKGEPIDVKYEVPTCLLDPKTKKGDARKPYLRFMEDERTTAFENGFVVFTPVVFEQKKKEIDASLK